MGRSCSATRDLAQAQYWPISCVGRMTTCRQGLIWSSACALASTDAPGATSIRVAPRSGLRTAVRLGRRGTAAGTSDSRRDGNHGSAGLVLLVALWQHPLGYYGQARGNHDPAHGPAAHLVATNGQHAAASLHFPARHYDHASTPAPDVRRSLHIPRSASRRGAGRHRGSTAHLRRVHVPGHLPARLRLNRNAARRPRRSQRDSL